MFQKERRGIRKRRRVTWNDPLTVSPAPEGVAADMIGGDIGWAVAELVAGNRVTRMNWNGKGMWLALVHGQDISLETEVQDFVAMRTVQGTMVPWLCSQSDLLAEDWVLADDGGLE